MPKPIKWREMVRRLRAFGWGPPVMWKSGKKIIIPNPHKGDIDWSLAKRILNQAGITEDEWNKR